MRRLFGVVLFVSGLAFGPLGVAHAQATHAEAARPITVWTVGDSTAHPLGNGVADRLGTKGPYRPRMIYRNSSGLIRADFFDWYKIARQQLAQNAPEVALISFGSNDIQGIHVRGTRDTIAAPGTDQWKALYEEKVEAFVDMFTAHNVRVYLVAQVFDQSKKFAPALASVNSVFQSVAEKHKGVTYVNAFALLADETGTYTRLWKDEKGRTIKLQNDDGVHLTGAGGRRLADLILQAVAKDVGTPLDT